MNGRSGDNRTLPRRARSDSWVESAHWRWPLEGVALSKTGQAYRLETRQFVTRIERGVATSPEAQSRQSTKKGKGRHEQ